MTYENVEQRIAQTYIDMFPPFIPDEYSIANVSEQREFYNMMESLYRLAFDEPLLFVAKLHEDDVYPDRFNKSAYGKPALQSNMSKFTKAIEELLQNMFLLGKGENVKLSKRQVAILLKIELDNFENLPSAWVWMSTRPGADITAFSYCFYRNDYPYTSDIYARIFGETAFRKLENWLREQRYTRFDINSLVAAGRVVPSLTYANTAWDKKNPKDGFLSKVKHTGISVMYDPYVKYPAIFGICIPNDIIKTLLQSFDLMNEKLQAFVIDKNIKCWDCRFCIQTDKTGIRPRAYIPVVYEKKEYKLCLRFPGYSYCWTKVDDALTENIIEMLAFMDRLKC